MSSEKYVVGSNNDGWLKYSLYFSFPNKKIDHYNISMELNGKGEIWLDDFGMEVLNDNAEVDKLNSNSWKGEK